MEVVIAGRPVPEADRGFGMRRLWLLELKLAARRGENVLVTFAFPIGTTLLLATGLLSDVSPTEAVARGIAIAIVSGAFVSTGINAAYERQQGVLQRLGATPLGPWGLIGAKVLSGLTLLVIQIALVAVTGVFVGWTPRFGVGLLVAFLLGTVAFAGIGIWFASFLRAEANLAVTNGIFVLLLLLGGLAVGPDSLPQAITDLISFGPVVPMVDGILHGLGESASPNWAVLAAWAVASVTLASRGMRWHPTR